MPNPLDRGPSSTPEAGSFASLGVANVGGSEKVLGDNEAANPSTTFDNLKSGLSYQDFPNLLKTRQLLLTDRFLDYGIYSSHDDSSQPSANRLVGEETLTTLEEQAKQTWGRLDSLSGIMSDRGRIYVLGAISVQRELAPAYAFLPSVHATNVIDGLIRLQGIEPHHHLPSSGGSGNSGDEDPATNSISFTNTNSLHGNYGPSSGTSLTGRNQKNGCLGAAKSISFAGRNNGYGIKASDDSVSFSGENDFAGVATSSYSVSLANKNKHSMIYASKRCFSAVATPPTNPVNMSLHSVIDYGADHCNNLGLILGPELPNTACLIRNPGNDLTEGQLIIIEDRDNFAKANLSVNRAYRTRLFNQRFGGALIVGGKVIYDSREDL